MITVTSIKMFEKIETGIPGCFLIKPRIFNDDRGSFIKVFHSELFEKLGLRTDFREEYYSVSSKGVIRGLHFQTPPSQHVKCISCLNGSIFDAIVDLRKDSPGFGKNYTVELRSSEPAILYIPEGLAHGFMALEDNTIFLNKTTTVFDPVNDTGIHFDSCGINWPGLTRIVSEKDQNMTPLNEYDSPF